MEPLQVAGLEGIVMTSGDDISQWCHPIFAIFVGDYPEQAGCSVISPVADRPPDVTMYGG